MGSFIPRDMLLDNTIYIELKDEITKLKKLFSSSALTSLQTNSNS